MTVTIRIKSRMTGASGAPTALKSGELAWQGVDKALYIGDGDDGSGNATSIQALAGSGATVNTSGDQSVAGIKTFTSSPIVPTPATADDSTAVATTAFVKAQNYAQENATLTFTGDATGSGAANASIAMTLSNTGVTAGSYARVSVDAKGRITNGSQLVDADIPSIPHTRISDFDAGVQANTLNSITAPDNALNLNSQRIFGLADPTGDNDAANKKYVDDAVKGLEYKDSVQAATTGNITLSGAQTIDGVALAAGARVLVKDQTDPTENGIYIVVDPGAWTRADDFDEGADIDKGNFVYVEGGTTQGNQQWVLNSNGNPTLGTDNLTFTQFGSTTTLTGGTNISVSGSAINLDPSVALTGGMGLGGATSDATNVLSINGPATLLNNGSGSVNSKLSKNAAGSDATTTYQTNFSTRAITGTQGNDDYTLKVSPDGSSFFDAYVADAATGNVDFKQVLSVQGNQVYDTGDFTIGDYALKSGDTFTGNVAITTAAGAVLTMNSSATDGVTSEIVIGGARETSTTGASNLTFRNDTSAAYDLAQISAYDPQGDHTQGDGALNFQVGIGGSLASKGFLDENGLTLYDRVLVQGGTVWHGNNDGSGSGLDADLLDGNHAAAFALLTGATFTGGISGTTGDFSGAFNLNGGGTLDGVNLINSTLNGGSF